MCCDVKIVWKKIDWEQRVVQWVLHWKVGEWRSAVETCLETLYARESEEMPPAHQVVTVEM